MYGACDDVPLAAGARRYEPRDQRLRAGGIDESRPLDFHSPYGCSKGAADQYVRDYARSFGLPAVVFRMSCVYGPHQFGTEDQGWVAHFVIRAIDGQPLTIYGDGKQVRDILFVDDLVDALLEAREQAEALAGRAFNVGGGAANTISLLELLDLVRELHGELPEVRFAEWRTGDQKHYVSDIQRPAHGHRLVPARRRAPGCCAALRVAARVAGPAGAPAARAASRARSQLRPGAQRGAVRTSAAARRARATAGGRT